MRQLLIVSFLFFNLLTQAQSGIDSRIQTIITDIHNYNQKEWLKDSSNGYLLRVFTEESLLNKYNFYKETQKKLLLIDRSKLAFDDQINIELLEHGIKDTLSIYEYKYYLNPLLSDVGFHTGIASRAYTTFSNLKDAQKYITLLQDVPRYVEDFLKLMRRGLTIGISQPDIIVIGLEPTYKSHIVDSIENSIFWKPFANRPFNIKEDDWNMLQANAGAAIKQKVIPSYRKIQSFFQNEYLPKTRKTLGASAFPQGGKFYEDRVRHYTTTDLSSEEVFQIGLKEVARIKSDMDKVITQVSFKGSFKEFISYLRTDTRFQPKSAEALLMEASYIAKKVDGKLPSLFGKLPRQPYTVAPVPEYLAPAYTTGRYSGAPIDSKRSGEYWVNTYNLPSRTLYTLEALTLHEAVPGHHLQIALTQELENLPPFRKNFYINAFGEGWGLYSEYLGHEMGFYKDPYSLFGRLTYEMWRACRLVIDVGIHTKNWTREQAVAYLADHTALSLYEVNTEINRYISWPGQALAYKIGEIKIKEMRAKAELALKEKFDVRAFHDMVLSNGTVTLSLLEKMTERFIIDQQRK